MNHTTSWLRRILLVNLVLQVLIVVTGGVVRLTGSGLGCPSWPNCQPGSYSPVVVEAVAYHQYVENGNRLLGAVVMAAAVAVLVALHRWARDRRVLRVLAWCIVGGTAAQVLLGGVTVLTGLHPATVTAHFLISMALVATSTALVWRERQPDGPVRLLVPPVVRRLAALTSLVLVVVLVLGTVVTGSGPHSGDAEQPARFGFDPRTVSWLHADSVMLFVGLVLAMLVATSLVKGASRAREVWGYVLAISVVQGLVGYTQYLTDLPVALVLVHMLGAALLTLTVTLGVLTLGEHAPAPAPAPVGSLSPTAGASAAAGPPPRPGTAGSGS